jgi:hypothetical protein
MARRRPLFSVICAGLRMRTQQCMRGCPFFFFKARGATPVSFVKVVDSLWSLQCPSPTCLSPAIFLRRYLIRSAGIFCSGKSVCRVQNHGRTCVQKSFEARAARLVPVPLPDDEEEAAAWLHVPLPSVLFGPIAVCFIRTLTLTHGQLVSQTLGNTTPP